MTVAALSTYPVQYECNGVLDTFTFDFNVNSGSDVEVILTDSDGGETVLAETTDYAVSATNDDFSSGGTVTTVGIYASGNTLTIRMAVAITQASAFTENMATLYETFENGLDKLTRIAQQLNEAFSRALSFTKSSGESGEGIVPAPSSLQYLRWNTGATALENAELVALGDLTAHTADAQAHAKVVEAVSIGAAGVLALSSVSTKNFFAVSAESGTEDTLTQITGLAEGDIVILKAAAGHIITVQANVNILMASDFVLDSYKDRLMLICDGSNVFAQLSRASNN